LPPSCAAICRRTELGVLDGFAPTTTPSAERTELALGNWPVWRFVTLSDCGWSATSAQVAARVWVGLAYGSQDADQIRMAGVAAG